MLVWLSCILWLSRGLHAAPAPLFPNLAVTDLNGLAAALPRAVSGPCLVVVGFSHASGEGCSQWQVHGCGSGLTSSACPVVEVVELESAPFFVAPLVRRALREKVPAGLFGRVFIAQEGRQTLQAALGYDGAQPDDPYLALLNRSGEIEWFGHGPWSQGRQDALLQALRLIGEGVPMPQGSPAPH
jgi:hypothetical protein